MEAIDRDASARSDATPAPRFAASPVGKEPHLVLRCVVAAVMALFSWNYLLAAQAERWALDRAYVAAHASFGAAPADLAALSVAEQRLAASPDVVASEEARSRAESRIRAAREAYAQAGRNAASRTIDRTGFLMNSPEWFAYLGALWLVALLPAGVVVRVLLPRGGRRAVE
jgi:hypothetical protein